MIHFQVAKLVVDQICQALAFPVHVLMLQDLFIDDPRDAKVAQNARISRVFLLVLLSLPLHLPLLLLLRHLPVLLLVINAHIKWVFSFIAVAENLVDFGFDLVKFGVTRLDLTAGIVADSLTTYCTLKNETLAELKIVADFHHIITTILLT